MHAKSRTWMIAVSSCNGGSRGSRAQNGCSARSIGWGHFDIYSFLWREREREREREEAILPCVYVSTTAWLPGVLARCVLGAVPPCKSYNHHFNRL